MGKIKSGPRFRHRGLPKVVEVLGGWNDGQIKDVYVLVKRENGSCEAIGVDSNGEFEHEPITREKYDDLSKQRLSESGNRNVFYGRTKVSSVPEEE